MKSLKDFLHDTNDLIIAALIVILAAFLIVWRFNAIMDYPNKAAAQSHQQTESVEVTNYETGTAFKDGVLSEGFTVTIGEGGDEAALAELFDNNIFEDYAQLEADLAMLDKTLADITEGTYAFSQGDTIEDVLNALASGPNNG